MSRLPFGPVARRIRLGFDDYACVDSWTLGPASKPDARPRRVLATATVDRAGLNARGLEALWQQWRREGHIVLSATHGIRPGIHTAITPDCSEVTFSLEIYA